VLVTSLALTDKLGIPIGLMAAIKLLLQETGGSGHMLKKQLMEAAQPLAEQSFTIVSLFNVYMFL